MAGDNSVRSLLEKMTECASNAYLSILERLITMPLSFLLVTRLPSKKHCATISALSLLLLLGMLR